MDTKLTRAEAEIMNHLWSLEAGATFGDILYYFQNEGDRGWKKQTLNTYLRKLIDKGLISTQKIGTKLYYSAALEKESFGTLKSQEVINEYYNGSTSKFFAAFSSANSITQEEANELLELLKKK